MYLKLIAPARKPEWGESFWDLKTMCELTGRKAGGAPLALLTLAALTSPDVEVTITDENVEPIDFDERVDLVGITFYTCLAPRAYEIADEFRSCGVPVTLGGIHTSMLPEEAVQHADSVVIGEAEEIWPQLISDFREGKMQKFYHAPRFPDLTDHKNAPIPRWDLLENDKYCYFTIQTGRGCPHDCDFCSVKVFNGRKYRHKTIEKVVEEVKTLQKINPRQPIFFADDNLLAVPSYARALMEALIPLKINAFWCQSSVDRLKDDNLSRLLYDAGCQMVFVGFESVSQKSLDLMTKSKINKVEEYKEIVEKVHSHGIAVFGSFVFGSDADDETIFEDTVKFIDDTNISFSMINILTPLPGTRLCQRVENENRLLHRDWKEYDAEKLCFKPKLISAESLQKGHDWVLQQLYSYDALYKRLDTLGEKGIYIRSKNDKLISVLLAQNFHDYANRFLRGAESKHLL